MKNWVLGIVAMVALIGAFVLTGGDKPWENLPDCPAVGSDCWDAESGEIRHLDGRITKVD